jgi:hypothetical protein
LILLDSAKNNFGKAWRGRWKTIEKTGVFGADFGWLVAAKDFPRSIAAPWRRQTYWLSASYQRI